MQVVTKVQNGEKVNLISKCVLWEEEEQRNREVVSTQLVYGTPARFEGWIGKFFFSLLSSAGLVRDPCCNFFFISFTCGFQCLVES